MVPMFSPKILENFVDVFSLQSEILSRKLEARAGKGSFSIWTHLSSYTLDSVCETTLGIKLKAQDDPKTPFLFYLNKLLDLITQRIFHLWLQPDWMFKLFPQFVEHEECVRVLHEFTDQVIKKKREELKIEKIARPEADSYCQLQDYKNKSFLDLLILLSGGERGYSDEELREEVLTLIIAGTDTSAVGIGNTLKLLAKYPGVQEKLYLELRHVFGDSDRPLVKDDLPKLKYLERVIKETLRLFPPVPFIIRKVLTEMKLPSGHVLPIGSGVVVSIWGVHRHPKYWGPDADKFDPDRFLPERFQLSNPCAYMPFSNGPRNCLGYQYALMSMKTAVARILRSYRVVGDEESSPNPQMRVKLNIMMKAVDNYSICLEKRDR
ncbi:cytochrome P450 4C1-like isoform X2 [Leptidea sinapis]|nr:cytochrome P450 4C1-like isoform X2 [Leptidea sinapis]